MFLTLINGCPNLLIAFDKGERLHSAVGLREFWSVHRHGFGPPKNSSGANDVIAIDHVLQPRLEFVIDTSLKYLSKHGEPLSPLKAKNLNKQPFGPRKKKLNGHIFVELFSRDLDKKMTSASYKRERNKNKVAPCKADNLFNLFTTCSLSRTG